MNRLSAATRASAAVAWLALVPAQASAQEEAPACRAPAQVSRFWQNADALCARAQSLAAASAPLAPAEQSARDELLAYCQDRSRAPAFAAAPEPERVRLLGSLLRAAGLPDALAPALVEPPASGLADSLLQRLAPDEALRTGAVGSLALQELTSYACGKAEVQPWLPSVCGAPLGAQALLQLRRRLAVDLVRMPRAALAGAPASADEAREGLRMAAVALDTISQTTELIVLARRMAADAAGDLRGLSSPCAADDERRPGGAVAQAPPRPAARSPWLAQQAPAGPQAPAALALPAAPADPLRTAGRVLMRILEDGPAVDRSEAFYQALVGRALREQGLDPRLTPAQQQALRALLDAIRQAQAAARGLPAQQAGRAAELRALLVAMAQVVERAQGVVTGQRVAANELALQALDALWAGDWRQGVALLVRASQQGGVRAPSAAAVKALEVAAAVATAPGEQARRQALLELLAPFPWRKDLLFDLNGSWPRFKEGEALFTGDVTLGFNRDGGGVVGFASVNYNETTNARGSILAFRRAEAAVDGWLVTEPGSTRFEGRLSTRADGYFTSPIKKRSIAITEGDENSVMGRASALGGLRLEPKPSFSFGVWAGAGLQYERYLAENIASIARGRRSVNTSVTLLTSGRIRMQATLIEDVLVLRLRSDVVRFQITRSTEMTNTGASIANPNRTAKDVQESWQVDATNRLFLDVEALRFSRFVPSVHAGLDVFASSTLADTLVVPLAGVGIRSDVF